MILFRITGKTKRWAALRRLRMILFWTRTAKLIWIKLMIAPAKVIIKVIISLVLKCIYQLIKKELTFFLFVFLGVSSLDPLLTEDTYRNNLKNSGINNSSSIETQTELDYNKMFDDSDELSSYFVSSANNETQTTEDFDDFEPMHLYSNMYTQTCDDIFSTSLNLADIQTQTAYSPISETDAKLQDKEFQYPMSHHMETQTNLLHMFDDLDAWFFNTFTGWMYLFVCNSES